MIVLVALLTDDNTGDIFQANLHTEDGEVFRWAAVQADGTEEFDGEEYYSLENAQTGLTLEMWGEAPQLSITYMEVAHDSLAA